MSNTYPLRVEGTLDAPLSRWLWAFKWLLAIPHYVVLVFLWPAFAVMSVVAFVAILVTGRYPRAIFNFNVGVLRWSWRVGYYSYGALGTDRYPPFTLAEVPDYPAHLEVEYPEHLSRGLALVKWWLLAIPHYLVVGLFVGGAWAVWPGRASSGGLIGIFVLVSAVVLAVTGSYPKSLYDLVLGLNRWVLRVAAYAGLMTDEYPPFRLDLGGTEGHVVTVPPPSPPARERARGGWTGGRIVSVVAGSLLLMLAAGIGSGGAFALWADRTQRDSAGYLSTGAHSFTTTTYVLSTDAVDLRGDGPGWTLPSTILDSVRVRVTARGSGPVFAGIADSADADRYLAGVERAVVTRWDGGPHYRTYTGSAPVPPADADFWVVSASGAGTQTLDWPVEQGRWTLVVMNADATRNVAVRAAVGVKVPALPWVAFGLLAGAALLAVPATALVVVAIRRAGTSSTR